MTSSEMPTASEDHRGHEYAIIVDGQKRVVASDIVSYVQVVEVAYPGQSGNPQYTFTVTYRNAAGDKRDGMLVSGQTVQVKREGTVFNVTRTTRS